MGIAERRERERHELRSKIVDAARELFANEGYDAVTMRRLAERIEYSPTAIYLHFPDKLSVLRAVCDCDFLALAETFHSIARIADPIARLRAAGQAYCRFALEHPNHYRMMFMTPLPEHHDAEQLARKGDPDQDAYAFLQWTVGEALSQGRLRADLGTVELDLIAQTIWSAMHGVVALRIAKGNDSWIEWHPAEAAVNAAIDMVLHGLLRDGDPARATSART